MSSILVLMPTSFSSTPMMESSSSPSTTTTTTSNINNNNGHSKDLGEGEGAQQQQQQVVPIVGVNNNNNNNNGYGDGDDDVGSVSADGFELVSVQVEKVLKIVDQGATAATLLTAPYAAAKQQGRQQQEQQELDDDARDEVDQVMGYSSSQNGVVVVAPDRDGTTNGADDDAAEGLVMDDENQQVAKDGQANKISPVFVVSGEALGVDDAGDDEDDDPPPPLIVNDNQGGVTPLFMSIEESNWHDALKHLTQSQVRTWVQSTSTSLTANDPTMTEALPPSVNNYMTKVKEAKQKQKPQHQQQRIQQKTWSTSKWTRLPIHEACRRQAPAWFVSRLLSLYPESAALKTQFGELPLHLAVECGAAPEVVNLLVVAYWNGIAETDHLGRTPLDILQESSDELLCSEDYKVVYESLVRSQYTWDALQQKHAQEMAQLRLKQNSLPPVDQVEAMWRQRVEALEKELDCVLQEVADKRDEVTNLACLLMQKNQRIRALETETAGLKADLETAFHGQRLVAQTMTTTVEQNLEKLVSSIIQVQDLMTSHNQSLFSALKKQQTPPPKEQDLDEEVYDDEANSTSSLTRQASSLWQPQAQAPPLQTAHCHFFPYDDSEGEEKRQDSDPSSATIALKPIGARTGNATHSTSPDYNKKNMERNTNRVRMEKENAEQEAFHNVGCGGLAALRAEKRLAEDAFHAMGYAALAALRAEEDKKKLLKQQQEEQKQQEQKQQEQKQQEQKQQEEQQKIQQQKIQQQMATTPVSLSPTGSKSNNNNQNNNGVQFVVEDAEEAFHAMGAAALAALRAGGTEGTTARSSTRRIARSLRADGINTTTSNLINDASFVVEDVINGASFVVEDAEEAFRGIGAAASKLLCDYRYGGIYEQQEDDGVIILKY